MGALSWLLTGLVVGFLARKLAPTKDGPRGCLVTLFVGWTGAVFGGFLATALGFGGLSGFDVRSLVTATLGAILLLILAELRYRSR